MHEDIVWNSFQHLQRCRVHYLTLQLMCFLNTTEWISVMLRNFISFSCNEIIHLKKNYKKKNAKIQFLPLAPAVGKVWKFFRGALYIIYEFIYTVDFIHIMEFITQQFVTFKNTCHKKKALSVIIVHNESCSCFFFFFLRVNERQIKRNPCL